MAEYQVFRGKEPYTMLAAILFRYWYYLLILEGKIKIYIKSLYPKFRMNGLLTLIKNTTCVFLHVFPICLV